MNTTSRAFLLAFLVIATPSFAGRASPAAAASRYATPRFTDAGRETRARAVAPQIDPIFVAYAAEKHVPGLVWGVVLDGRLIHTGMTGYANLERKIPAAADTRFRIASMTKSFTALAILKLRDAGRLSLHDRVDKFLPEFASVRPLTTDAPPINIWNLLTMTAGFPEDNPWGDRQLAVGEKELSDFLRGGVALSNAPGVAYEYSNLGYALLGQIISRIAREPYQRYITREILMPLGMRDTKWEYTDVPPDKLALGYRWTSGRWQVEPLLHDGTYGAMGGLLTTLNDFARCVSFHLDAWPPRDDRDNGIVRRATVREMHQGAVFSSLGTMMKNAAGDTVPAVNAYGYGLRITTGSDSVTYATHGGGLPGFGTNYRFYPEHGLAIISLANLTYIGPAAANEKAGALLIDQARLPRRTLPPSPILAARRQQVADLIQSWDAGRADEIVAENFFLDRPREEWIQHSREVFSRAGAIKSVGEIVPLNQLRGTFPVECANGRVDVFFTLTPESTPKLQALKLTFVERKT